MLEREPNMKGYELLAGAKLFSYLKAGRPIQTDDIEEQGDIIGNSFGQPGRLAQINHRKNADNIQSQQRDEASPALTTGSEKAPGCIEQRKLHQQAGLRSKYIR